ncbi:nuclear transport factor 2 family protein [Leisingera daeponensis]|uniref:Nuclear transport factor 2 family protein n=1 Tax=Leisingera daeponensis TaxID=405746 RepID=A0ABS7N9S8_9RHOB|nr:nuclear transport factor 2 family protein [Leisingera daeponensis]MBY6137957.1 nuclear transport factor 2 family protein [Leisingera daeponensis]
MTTAILTDGPQLAEILALETKVWEALAAGDPVADGRLLTEDFLGVYPSGFSDKSGHCDQLKDGPVMRAYRLSNAQLRVITAEAVLLSYRASYLAAGGSEWSTMLISSLWEQDAGSWRNSFSQDTPENE